MQCNHWTGCLWRKRFPNLAPSFSLSDLTVGLMHNYAHHYPTATDTFSLLNYDGMCPALIGPLCMIPAMLIKLLSPKSQTEKKVRPDLKEGRNDLRFAIDAAFDILD